MSEGRRGAEPEANAPGEREAEAPLPDELDDEARAVLDEVGAGDEGEQILDEVDVRELLRSALAPQRTGPPPELLRGVQKRIRQRSRGKFYGDGWSTTRSPRSTYMVTSLLMLLLMALVFFVLVPWGGGALP